MLINYRELIYEREIELKLTWKDRRNLEKYFIKDYIRNCANM